jgi:hypothetical protein
LLKRLSKYLDLLFFLPEADKQIGHPLFGLRLALFASLGSSLLNLSVNVRFRQPSSAMSLACEVLAPCVKREGYPCAGSGQRL